MIRTLVAGAFIWGGLWAAAAAQTADETVAYILYGLEDGRMFVSAGGTVAVKQTPGKAEFNLMAGVPRQLTSTIGVTAIDHCVYAIKIEERSGKSVAASIDFSKLIDLKLDRASLPWLHFKGECAIKGSQDGSEQCENKLLLSYDIEDPQRLANALAYFRREFCRGAAF